MIIIDDKLINEAIELAKPSIEKILSDPRFVWGPKYVWISVFLPDKPYSYVVGKATEWDPKWSEKPVDIQALAFEKAMIAMREKNDTGALSRCAPWLFKENEHLYAGGINYADISIGVSGANESTDENIASIVMLCITLLAREKGEALKKSY